MAAPTKYATPLEQLMALAREAIAGGVDFEEFWIRSVRPGKTIVMSTTTSAPLDCIRWPTDREDRIGWQRALAGAKDGIRRAYLNLPALPQEAALIFLAPALAELRAAEAAREEEVDELTDLMAA